MADNNYLLEKTMEITQTRAKGTKAYIKCKIIYIIHRQQMN